MTPDNVQFFINFCRQIYNICLQSLPKANLEWGSEWKRSKRVSSEYQKRFDNYADRNQITEYGRLALAYINNVVLGNDGKEKPRKTFPVELQYESP